MSYPPNQGGYPPQQTGAYGYPSNSGQYPPQNTGYPPQNTGYPPQNPGYPPQNPGYPPQSNAYPTSSSGQNSGIGFESLNQPQSQNYGGFPSAYPPQNPSAYPPQNPSAYPPQQPGYQQSAYSSAPLPAQYNQPQTSPYGGAVVGQSGYAPIQQPQTGYGQPVGMQQPPKVYGMPSQYGQASSAPGYGGRAPNQQYTAHASGYDSKLGKLSTKMSAMQIKYHGSIKPVANFNAEQDAQILRKAMKGLGTDEKAITSVLGYRTNKQRQQILTIFKQAYGKDLIKELKSEIGGNYERLVLGLMMKPADFDCYCLYKAMSGAGTDEATLIEILASRSNAEIKEIKEIYKKNYKKVLEKELQSETSGHFRRLLVSLNNASRDESSTVDLRKAEEDANKLYQAGEKKWGTDESTFNFVMASRNHAQLRATFQAYQKISNRDITKSLSSEFSGDILKGQLAIVGVARDPPSYFASLLYKSMKGLGTNDDDLIRIVVTRSEVDMEEIKQRFYQDYKQPLSKFINDDASGDYKKLLLALVGN